MDILGYKLSALMVVLFFAIVIIWFIIPLLIAKAAGEKGRSGCGFFILCILFSPLIGGLILLLLGKNEEEIKRRNLEKGLLKKCPHCSNLIDNNATICTFCHKEIGKNLTFGEYVNKNSQVINLNWKDILIENNLNEYIEVFEKNKLTDPEILVEINESDLEKIGINALGDRKKIVKIFSSSALLEKIEVKITQSEELSDQKRIYESEFYNKNYEELMDELLNKYPVHIRRDIEEIEKTKGLEAAKIEIIKKLIKKN